MLKWRTFPNEEHSQMQNHSQMQPCQMPRFAKCSSMRERCWIRTPTYELTAAKLRKGLKGRGNRTSAVFKFNATIKGPCYACKRLQFTSAKSFNFFNVTSAKQKPANCFNSQVPRSLQNCFQFSSATQRPGNCFNSQVPGNLQNASTHNCLQTASTHRCRIKACKLLQFPLARKTCEMLSTHHLLADCLKSLSARNCKLLQFFCFPPMLCCVVLCCAMLCCVILCCVMLYYTMPCYALPRNIMPRYIMPRYTLPCAP